MPVFFNGRLWVSPATMSVVDDSAMFNRGLSVANVQAIVGRSVAGKPNTALRFGSPSEARNILQGGEGLTAIERRSIRRRKPAPHRPSFSCVSTRPLRQRWC